MTHRPSAPRVRWRHVALLASALAAVAGAALMAPLWPGAEPEPAGPAAGVEAAAQLQGEAGLVPCQDEPIAGYYRELDAILDRHVAGAPRLSITTVPAFTAESGVRLVGDQVFHVRLDGSLWHQAMSAGRGDGEQARPTARVQSAALSPATADAVVALLSAEIARAVANNRDGLDGVSFRFTVGGTCARAWSPRTSSRAGQLVALLEALQAHSQLGTPGERARHDAHILRLVEALAATAGSGPAGAAGP